MSEAAPDSPDAARQKRRPRYSGKYPRKFTEKYKERDPDRYGETVAKVLASGKTPAGTHLPIMVGEILEVLSPQPGGICVDCTVGYGGHARALLGRVIPGGRVIALDADPIELPRTEASMRAEGFGSDVFTAMRINFAGLSQALLASGAQAAECILADLGVSSMQLDDPARGFSLKQRGPLDLRMNPSRGMPASEFVARATPEKLAALLVENADEPQAMVLGQQLAGRRIEATTEFAAAVRNIIGAKTREEEREQSVRRVFQALRIAVNDEFSALDSLLRQVAGCLKPGGRVAILTFHSGEDRRVKKAFAAGRRDGTYSEIADDVIRPGSEERHANPRSTSAKLRWAQKAA